MADLIEKGIRVYGLNSSFYAPDNPELEGMHSAYREKSLDAAVDFMKFEEKNAAFLDKDPQGVYRKMLSSAKQKDGRLSESQRAGLSFAEDTLHQTLMQQNIPAKQAYREGVRSVFEVMHPNYRDVIDLYNKIQETPHHTDPVTFAQARLGADTQVADRIHSILGRETGMVVLYGIAHTVEALPNGIANVSHPPGAKDLDGALREKGIGVMIADPHFPTSEGVDCSPLMSSLQCRLLGDVSKGYAQAAAESGDPDRYAIPDVRNPGLIKAQSYQP